MMILGSAAAANLMVGLLIVALAVLLWRHQSPLPIRRGMSEAEVEDLLGRPARRTRAERTSTWIYTEASAQTVVDFRSGRLRQIRFG